MNDGWSTRSVIQALLLMGVIFACYHVLRSLDHQQKALQRVEDAIRAGDGGSRPIEIKFDGLPEIVVRHEGGGPVYVPTGSLPERRTSDPVMVKRSNTPRTTADGKDAMGRPLMATEGFTIYPPTGKDVPGRTSARTPEFVPQQAGTYYQGIPAEPDKINYYLTSNGRTQIIDRYVHERLFDLNPDDPTEIWPRLAMAWETSDDNLTFRFHLRKGVQFSDGSPFNADDVIWSYETIQDPNVESEHLKTSFDRVESVRKIDDYTIEVQMREKYWKALRQFGYYLRVLPQEYFEREIPKRAEERGIDNFSVTPGEPGFAEVFNTFSRSISPGTGPYRWNGEESWETNQHITLYPNPTAWIRKLNPDHWKLERLRWRIIRDDVAQMQAFRNGELDVLVVDHDQWQDRLSKDPEITSIANFYAYDHMALLYSFIGFNCRKFPFDEVAVRQAVAHCMDRERIWREIEREHGQIAVCPTKPIYPEYSHDIDPYPFDPERARQILLNAGWSDSDGDGFLDRDGKMLEFDFTFGTSRIFYNTVSTLLKESCERAGIRCNVSPKEWSLFITDFYNLDYNAACLYYSTQDPWIDPYENYHSSLVGPRESNHWGWVNPRVDELLEAMRREFDDEKRAKMFHELNKIFHAEVPKLLLLHGEVGVIQNRRINGASVRPTGMRPFPMWIDPRDVRRQ